MAGFRLSRALSVARRDLAAEFKGRQGLILPAVMAALLIPASAVPPPPREVVDLAPAIIRVTGDVPAEVAALDTVQVVRRGANLRFEQQGDTLIAHGTRVPHDMRAVLDRTEPSVAFDELPTGMFFPGRSMLFALISASTLTGAVSTSIGGERSQRTLTVLLTAAISRWEIVAGKWLAWGGLGVITAVLAATSAILLGHVAPGVWLLPMATVPLATVAFGLWLVRSAGDVIAGSTTSLRVLPAATGVSALVAWFLGQNDPLVGALVPVGGALIAAGDTWAWSGPLAPILAASVTMVFCALCLHGTTRDLDEVPPRDLPDQRAGLALGLGTLAALTWWLPLTVPLLWTEAGNAQLTEQLGLETGLLAGALGLLAFSMVRAGRSSSPAEDLGTVGRPGWSPWLLGIGGGVVLAMMGSILGWWPIATDSSFLDGAHARLALGVQPVQAPWAVLLAVIVADELLFRGWLPRLVGPWWAGAVYVAVRTPLDPLGGAALATVLGLLGHRGGLVAPVLARVVWAVLATGLAVELPPAAGALVGLAAVGGLGWWASRAPLSEAQPARAK